MTKEQEIQSGEIQRDWAQEVANRLPGYMVTNQGTVVADDVLFNVFYGRENNFVEVKVSRAQVAKMMEERLGLTPIIPQRYINEPQRSDTTTHVLRPVSYADKKREFRKAYPLGLALGRDTTEAVRIGWSIALENAHRGKIIGERDEHELKSKDVRISQALITCVIDETIPRSQRHTLESLQKYIGIWVGAAHDRVATQTMYYGKQNHFPTSPRDTMNTLPNSAEGYALAHKHMDSMHPRDQWNRYMIHFTSATDDPDNFDLYDDITTSVIKQMDYVGIIPIGNFAGYSLLFRRAIAQYRKSPANVPRLTEVSDSRAIPNAMRQLFGPNPQIHAQNE